MAYLLHVLSECIRVVKYDIKSENTGTLKIIYFL